MPVRRASSHTSGSTLGGRLSTTYQPRSSRLLAAVERPAPDIPVTTTRRSGAASSSGASWWRSEVSVVTALVFRFPITDSSHDPCGRAAGRLGWLGGGGHRQ